MDVFIMIKRTIMYATLLCSTLGSYHHGACSETIAVVNKLQEVAPIIKTTLDTEFKSNPALKEKLETLVICCKEITLRELRYLNNNGEKLVIIMNTILLDPTKTPALDPILQSVIKKLWNKREPLFTK